MSWLQISVEIGSDLTELAADVFAAAGALSVTLLDAADEPLLEPAPGDHPLWSRSRVVALFPTEFEAAALIEDLRTALSDPKLPITIERLEDRDWSTTWRDNFHAMRFGKRLWICPVGEIPPEGDAVVVQMDPGLAFGTGTHATTALCLEWLDAHPPAGRSVIDYGCGSGILSIAACKLGAGSVRAVDIDPQALLATRENAARNGIGQGLDVMLPEAMPPGPVDVVMANILSNPLIELAATLANQVRGGGRIVLTGILEAQAVDVLSAYQPWFDFTAPVQREEWMLLEGAKQRLS